MSKFKKDILKVGLYKSPDGPVPVTEDRMAHWCNQFKKMSLAGLKIPIPWGHNSKAKPDLSYDEKEFYESKYNAGFLDGLEIEDGTLKAVIDVPREDDGSRIGTVVQEVSPQIETFWRDGQGRIWNDVITHLALVTHPVVPGQENFVPLETKDAPLPAYSVRLSLSKKYGEKDMADELEKKEPPEAKKPEEKKEPMEMGKEEKKPEGMEEVIEETPPPKEDTAAGSGGHVDQSLLDLLASIGLVLPDDTTDDNFVENLKTSALTLKTKIDELEGGEDTNNLEAPGGSGEEDDAELEELAKALAGGGQQPGGEPSPQTAAPPPSGPGAGSNLTEAPPQMTMNLDKNPTALEQRLSLALNKLEESERKAMKADIRMLVETGRITPVIAQRLEQESRGFRLSLNDRGEQESSLVQAKIEEFKLMPEGSAWSSEEKVRMRNAAEEALPHSFSSLNDEQSEKLAEMQLRYSGKGVAIN